MAYLWLAFLLALVDRAKSIDAWLNADASAIEDLKEKMKKLLQEYERIPSTNDYLLTLCLPFFVVFLSQWIALKIAAAWSSVFGSYFWLIVFSTTIGLFLSFIPKLRDLTFAGAQKLANLAIFIVCILLGMDMNIIAVADYPGLILVGLIILLVHAIILFGIAKLIRAPTFFICVGSQANIGGVASAPIVAAAFHSTLAPVGAMTAILGNIIGTYCAVLSGILMEAIVLALES